MTPRIHRNTHLRQDHVAGKKMFVDFPGQTVPLYDAESEAVVLEAQIFVSVLGASNYVYAEALPSQQLVPWVNAHAHALASPRLTATNPSSTSPISTWHPTSGWP
jgi:transposase